MQIRTRMSISAVGYVTTPDGWPSLTADPQFASGRSHGFTTFEPALGADRWPWPDLDVFVLGSHVPTAGAPVPIVTDSDPVSLLEQLRAANRGGDVHLIGGPRTLETFRDLGALDKLGLLVLPFFLGGGLRLTPSLSLDTQLVLESERTLPEGAVEIVYTCT